MKGFSLLTVMLLLIGVVLIYSGVKSMSPADTFRQALNGTLGKNNDKRGSSFDKTKPTASGSGGGGGGGGSW